MNEVKLGIIGFGNMGTTHAQNVKQGKVKGMKLSAICDISEQRREAAKKVYTDIPIFETAEELYKSGVCNAVLIAVPHYDHPTLTIRAFDYGLNVIVEKPAGVYTKQVKEMNEVAKKSGRLFGIMYNQRTRPVYQKLREMIQCGDLGGIKRITWIITDWYRPQAYHDERSHDDTKVVVVCNFTSDNAAFGYKGDCIGMMMCLSNYSDSPDLSESMTLRPYEAVVYKHN